MTVVATTIPRIQCEITELYFWKAAFTAFERIRRQRKAPAASGRMTPGDSLAIPSSMG